jgi:glycosyltransferase involved in cell wall biosynthesis
VRILLVTDLFAPVVGGLELHVQALAEELARRGHHVAVATQAQPGRPAREAMDGYTVHRIDGWSRLLAGRYADPAYRFHPPAPDPGMGRTLAAVVAAEAPDVVHAHGWMLYSCLALGRRVDHALVATLHDFGLVCPRKTLWRDGRACGGPSLAACAGCASGQYGFARGLALTAALRGSRALHARVDRFVAVSEAVRAGSMAGALGRPIEVVPNFLARGVADGAAGPRPASLPAGDGYLLFVGEISPHKGADALLAAHALLDDPPPLVLIGRVPPGFTVPDRPGVTVVPQAPRARVMAAWTRAAAGVVPSVWNEPCPTVAIEAATLGVPVVASAVGGLPELVPDGVAGLLVPPADPAALAAALDRLRRDPSLRASLGAGARAHAQQFSADAVVGRIEDVYRRARADRRARRTRAAA